MDLDRRVRRGRERLSQEVEPAPPSPLSAEKAEQLSVLEEKIKNLLEQVEALGEAGKVDEAEALMRKVLICMPGWLKHSGHHGIDFILNEFTLMRSNSRISSINYCA